MLKTHDRRPQTPSERVAVAVRPDEVSSGRELFGMLALVILMIVVLLLSSGSVGG